MIKGAEEFIKGRFVSDTHIMACTPQKIVLYDVRKPSIILQDISQEFAFDCNEDNELNDFDFVAHEDLLKVAVSFDSGETKVFSHDLTR